MLSLVPRKRAWQCHPLLLGIHITSVTASCKTDAEYYFALHIFCKCKKSSSDFLCLVKTGMKISCKSEWLNELFKSDRYTYYNKIYDMNSIFYQRATFLFNIVLKLPATAIRQEKDMGYPYWLKKKKLNHHSCK